jgi:hypothetical protein
MRYHSHFSKAADNKNYEIIKIMEEVEQKGISAQLFIVV